MKVIDYILNKIENGTLHMGLVDPDEQSPEEAGDLAGILETAGSDAIMVGGSTGITKENLDKTVKSMSDRVELPIIHFPTRAGAMSQYVNAIYFMSMLNSRDLSKVIGEQVRGAPMIKKMNIEPIPMGYVIVEPGMKVGEVGNADLLSRENPKSVINYGLAAQYLGMKLFYLEAGSGSPEPVPLDMIKAYKENVDIPLIVGGGIRNYKQAKKIADAGADVIVTGTVLEESKEVSKKMKELISALKEC